MFTLLELIQRNPFDRVAVVIPEQNLRVTYGELYAHVQAVAEQLSAAGVGRGDRIGMALTNGLPMIVAFLAASEVGTAAPLNPAYTEDEFRFYLEDTNARVLILPPEGVDDARRAAGDRVKIVSIESLARLKARAPSNQPYAPPVPDDVALVLHARGGSRRNLAQASGRRAPALHPIVQRGAASARHACARAGVRRAGRRGVRHDRGRAPDDVQSAAACAAEAGIGRPRHRRARQHH